MKGMMNAMVLEGQGKLVYKKVPIPSIGPHDVLFKVSYAAICGGDIPAYKSLHYIQHIPIIIGHEFTGYVAEVGKEVKSIPIGMRFMGTNIEGCGECDVCKSGGSDLECPYNTRYGLGFGRDGVFAEYSVIHNAKLGESVIPLPSNLDDITGTICEPMSVGIGNVRKTILPRLNGERIVIFGAGIIGQSFIQAFKTECKECQIAVVDTSSFRLKLAKQSGADYVINPIDVVDAYDVITKLWGYGEFAYHDKKTKSCGNATIAVECTGNPLCVSQASEVVTSNGKVCYAAGYGDEMFAQIRPVNFMMKGIKVIPGLMGDFNKSVENISKGYFSTKHLVTHILSLKDLNEAMHIAMDPSKSCKVVIKVDENTKDSIIPL